MTNIPKKEPYGYTAVRPNFMPIIEQEEDIIEYGVHPSNVINSEEGIDIAVSWCGPDTDLVVASATVFGTVTEYDRVLKAMAKRNACLVVLRADNLRVDAKGTEAYRKGKNDLNLRNAAIGRTIGRKKSVTVKTAEKIIHFCRVQGNSQIKAAAKFPATTTQISKIMNGTYFEKNRGKAQENK